jgi:glycosyltransferase involved in cell wall biosynthesis
MLESDGPGGAEVLLFQLGEELRARGHRVVPVLPLLGSGWLGSKFHAAGFEIEGFHPRRLFRPRYLRDFVRRMRARKVQVIHSHEFTMAVLGAATARWIGCRHVVTMHGNQSMTSRLRRRLALRWAFSNSAAVTAVSTDTKVHLETSLGIRPGRIQTVLNGIPIAQATPDPVRREFALRDEEVLLLSVGSLVPRKGHAVLLDALALLEEEGCDVPWRLIIAGQGSEKEALAEQISRHRLEERVHLVGQREDIPNLQSAAQIFVMPSLWEGLPLAILEAMFSRSTVVASRSSGIPEAVTDGSEGLLVQPGDAGALASALRRVLEDRSLRLRLAEAAHLRAHASFSISRMTDAYEALYRLPSEVR